jgi:ADP-ribose pyrophosphatase YjhB (NUDIX family)
VDVVLFARRADDLALLAVERAKEPFVTALALPGGFIKPGERPVNAAARELAEETGIVFGVGGLRRLARYGTPGRDPRGRVVSVAYHGLLPTARFGIRVLRRGVHRGRQPYLQCKSGRPAGAAV